MNREDAKIITLDRTFSGVIGDDNDKIGNMRGIKERIFGIRDKSIDYTAPHGNMIAVPDTAQGIKLRFDSLEGGGEFAFSRWGLGQLCQRLNIPMSYASHCLHYGESSILCDNINAWMDKTPTAEVLMRTTDNVIHGVLSSAYKIYDDHEVWEVVENSMRELDEEFAIKSYIATPEEFKTRLVSRERINIAGFDYSIGMDVSNSRVGRSSVRIEMSLFKWICLNGLVAPTQLTANFRMKHSGALREVIVSSVENFMSTLPENRDKMINIIKACHERDLLPEMKERIMEQFSHKINRAEAIIQKIEDDYAESNGSKVIHLIDSITHIAKGYEVDMMTSMEKFAGNLLVDKQLIG